MAHLSMETEFEALAKLASAPAEAEPDYDPRLRFDAIWKSGLPDPPKREAKPKRTKTTRETILELSRTNSTSSAKGPASPWTGGKEEVRLHSKDAVRDVRQGKVAPSLTPAGLQGPEKGVAVAMEGSGAAGESVVYDWGGSVDPREPGYYMESPDVGGAVSEMGTGRYTIREYQGGSVAPSQRVSPRGREGEGRDPRQARAGRDLASRMQRIGHFGAAGVGHRAPPPVPRESLSTSSLISPSSTLRGARTESGRERTTLPRLTSNKAAGPGSAHTRGRTAHSTSHAPRSKSVEPGRGARAPEEGVPLPKEGERWRPLPSGIADLENGSLDLSHSPESWLNSKARQDTESLVIKASMEDPKAAFMQAIGEIDDFNPFAHTHKKKLMEEHEKIRAWYRSSFAKERPVGRGDVYQLWQWIVRNLSTLNDEANEVMATHNGADLQSIVKGDQKQLRHDWAFSGHGWRQRLKCMKKFQDLYCQAFSEIIRQVSAQCVERGLVMHAVWKAAMDLQNVSWQAIIRSAQLADRLQMERLKKDKIDQETMISNLEDEVASLKEQLAESTHKQGLLMKALEEERANTYYEDEDEEEEEKKPPEPAPTPQLTRVINDAMRKRRESLAMLQISQPAPSVSPRAAAAGGEEEEHGREDGDPEQDAAEAASWDPLPPSATGDIEQLEAELEWWRDEWSRLKMAFEDAQVHEEEAWAELKNMEEQRGELTPRPRWGDNEKLQEVLKAGGPEKEQRSTRGQCARVEKRLLEVISTLEAAPDQQDHPSGKDGGKKNPWKGAQLAAGAIGKLNKHGYDMEFSWEKAIEAVSDVEGEDPKPFFQGVGEGVNIPRFLRCTSKIKNKNLDKRLTEALVKEVWREKKKYDNERIKNGEDTKSELRSYLYVFLKSKYQQDNLIREMGYNILRGLKKFDYDADCELFLKVLVGDVSESVYDDQMTLMDDLIYLMKSVDEKANGKKTGIILTSDCSFVLREYFYTKNDDEFQEIVDALEEDCVKGQPKLWEAGKIEYASLFEEDKNFDQGPFVELIRDHHLQMRTQFLKEVDMRLKEVSHEGVHVSEEIAREVLLAVDPAMDEETCVGYLIRGFQMSNETYQAMKKKKEAIVTTNQLFLKGLKSGVIVPKQSNNNKRTKKKKNAPAHTDMNNVGKDGRRSSVFHALQALQDKWREEEGVVGDQQGFLISSGNAFKGKSNKVMALNRIKEGVVSEGDGKRNGQGAQITPRSRQEAQAQRREIRRTRITQIRGGSTGTDSSAWPTAGN